MAKIIICINPKKHGSIYHRDGVCENIKCVDAYAEHHFGIKINAVDEVNRRGDREPHRMETPSRGMKLYGSFIRGRKFQARTRRPFMGAINFADDPVDPIDFTGTNAWMVIDRTKPIIPTNSIASTDVIDFTGETAWMIIDRPRTRVRARTPAGAPAGTCDQAREDVPAMSLSSIAGGLKRKR